MKARVPLVCMLISISQSVYCAVLDCFLLWTECVSPKCTVCSVIRPRGPSLVDGIKTLPQVVLGQLVSHLPLREDTAFLPQGGCSPHQASEPAGAWCTSLPGRTALLFQVCPVVLFHLLGMCPPCSRSSPARPLVPTSATCVLSFGPVA